MGRLALGLGVVGVGASIASFAVETATNSGRWQLTAIFRGSEVLIVLSVAAALALGRRPGRTALLAQVAAAATALAFVIVALVKLHSASPHIDFSVNAPLNWSYEAGVVGLGALAFGLIGPRVRTPAIGPAFALTVFVAVGCAAYAIYGEREPRVDVWWAVALAMANLAGSAAARMERR
ncbi:MAG TPA: hypothetical protein VKR79_09820 [Gaiellaceae bacterium]|nr:hypothetical protein [Gaiellaceae bacterium]